jgi:anti-sigma factor RsiW
LGIQVPGYQEAQAKRAENALALLRGELPPDVAAQIQRRAASQALEKGFAGSGAGRNLVLRDLGRGSYDAARLGEQQFANILGTTPMAPLANYEFTPQQIAALRGGERSAQQQALLGVAGMPSATGLAGQAFGSLGSGLTNLGFAQLGAQSRAGTGGESDLVSTQRKLMG